MKVTPYVPTTRPIVAHADDEHIVILDASLERVEVFDDHGRRIWSRNGVDR